MTRPERPAGVAAPPGGTADTGGGGAAPAAGVGGEPASASTLSKVGRRVVLLGSPLFGGAVALASVGYFVEALHYSRGTSSSPGPGLFPQCIAVVLFVAGVGTAVTTRRPATPEGAAAADGPARPLRPVAVVAAAALFVGTLSSIGFFFAAALALVVVEVGMGVRNPFRVALFALLLAFAAQLLFVDVLGLKFFSSVNVLAMR